MNAGVSAFPGGNRTHLTLKSQTIIRGIENMPKHKMKPVHPGEILFEEFLKPMGISQNRVALDVRVPARRINEIVRGMRRITPDTALRLSKYFGVTPQFWLGLQMDYDLDVAEDELSEKIEKEVTVHSLVAR
jgi:addiction module HigA family antidote